MELECLDTFIINHNVVQLRVRIKGCYKMIINDTIVIPGNVSMITFKATKMSETVNFTFYGIRKKIKKAFVLRAHDVSLNIPPTTESNGSLAIREMEFDLQRIIPDRMLLGLNRYKTHGIMFEPRVPALNLIFENPTYINLDAFVIEKYKPINP